MTYKQRAKLSACGACGQRMRFWQTILTPAHSLHMMHARCSFAYNLGWIHHYEIAAEKERERAEHAENARLRKEDEGNSDAIIEMGDKLSRIVNITKGEPEPLHLHSTHDAVESVAALRAELDTAQAKVAEFEELIDTPCCCTPDRCPRCEAVEAMAPE